MAAATVIDMADVAQLNVGSVLSEVMQRHAITQQQLADVMDRGRTTIAGYTERDRLSWRVLAEVADGLNAILGERGFSERYTAASLQQGSEPANNLAEVKDDTADLRAELAELRRLVVRDRDAVDFYGPAPCGTPLFLDDEEVEPQQLELADVIEEPLTPGRHYVLQAEGDSMEPYIFEGDFMLVDHRRVPQVRDIVVANINDDGVTVKQLGPHPASGRLVLCPANPRHDPLELHELDEVDVQGVVIGCIRKFVSLVGPDPIARAQQTKRRR
ncbi:MAG: LexA repressor [Candidatus Omnitrophica bacterium]|nr:LexA repressor [Candidatus Omnitrophota bacterium]